MEPKSPQFQKISVEDSQVKRELTAEEKEIAKSLEDFSQLEVRDRVFLLLIWRGFKTASPVSIMETEPESAVSDLEEKVKKAGLLFRKTDIITKERKYGLRAGRICFVANNQKDLDLMSKLWFGDHEHDPKVYKEIGRMSGYPKTAINVFDSFQNPNIPINKREKATRGVLSDEEKKKLIASSEFSPDLYPFSRFFYMSKENWQNELQTVDKWAKELDFVCHELYVNFLLKAREKNTTIF